MPFPHINLIPITKIATSIKTGKILSRNKEERKDFSSYDTSTIVAPVKEIPISDNEVSSGFFVVRIS
jgi:hypothetical protein